MIIRIFVLASFFGSLDAFVLQRSASVISSTSLFYQNEEAGIAVVPTDTVATTPLPAETQRPKIAVQLKKKPTIYPVSSLDELHEFLQEDDDRLTAIKFFAPWCKTCQRLGMRYQRLAMEHGDWVDPVARKAVTGEMRCAEVEFGSVTSRFIHDQLQIEALPTLQLYKGTTKLWQGKGGDSIKHLKKEVKRLLSLSQSGLEEYVNHEVKNDGILEEAIEDSFFDNAYID